MMITITRMFTLGFMVIFLLVCSGVGSIRAYGEQLNIEFSNTLVFDHSLPDDLYGRFRIPGMVVTNNGILIAYTEARQNGGDWDPMDLVIKRSFDRGVTWQDNQVLIEGLEDGITVNNPVMIVGSDEDNTIHLIYCVEYGVVSRSGGVYYMKSTDDGATWSNSVDISSSCFTDEYDRIVFATGPGHGIELTLDKKDVNGNLVLDATGEPETFKRLLTPVWMAHGWSQTAHSPSVVSTLYSDDNGATWQMGEVVFAESFMPNPNETAAVQLSDGRVMLNMRNTSSSKRRAVTISDDGISNWSTPYMDDTLIDPICFGSIIRVDDGTIAFVNAASTTSRENITVRFSYDDGATWEDSKSIDPGQGAYADIAVDGTYIYVLYEKGSSIRLAKFTKDWVTASVEENTQVAKLTFDTIANGYFEDGTGYNNDAISNGATISSDGKINSCVSFTQDTDYVEIQNGMGLDFGTSDFSFGVWLKPTDLNGQRFIAWYGSNGGNQWWVRQNGNQMQFLVGENGAEDLVESDAGAIDLNEWQHFTFIRSNGEIMIYKNGTPIANKALSRTYNVNGANTIRFGKEKYNNNRPFKGVMDEIVLYNYALTTNEIQKIVGADHGGIEANLVAKYSFENASTTQIFDEVNNNDGVAYGITVESNGKNGKSVKFADSGDYIDITNQGQLDFGTSDFTVASWIFPTLFEGQQYVCWYGDKSGKQWWGRLEGDRLQFVVGSDGAETLVETSTGNLTLNEWNHFVLVREGLQIKIFINGQLASENTCGTAYNVNGTSDILRLGKAKYNSERQFRGQLDEFLLYNRALNSTEVTSLFTSY